LLPGADCAREIEELINQRADMDTIRTAIAALPGNDDKYTTYNALAIDVFTSVLLNLSSRTLEFTVAALTRYAPIFKQLVTGDEEAQMRLLSTVYDLWRANQQRLMFVIDKFIKMTVLDCATVVRWAFTPRVSQDLLT
jgi:nuclear cap-binding protein subunit 1